MSLLTDVPQSRGRRPLGPGLSSGALTVGLLVLLAALALTAGQPPLPSIAEFAPQAVQQIKDAPADQAGQSGAEGGGPGSGSGAAEGLGAGPEPAASDPAAAPSVSPERFIDVPRVRRCVGSPPRQIEDPQSPPCVPYWDPESDNGGATFKGVTATEIRIAVPEMVRGNERLHKALEAFFNKRFEFYGRKLRFFRPAGGPPEAMATEIADQIQAFASAGFATFDSGPEYYDALASRKILSVMTPYPFFTTEHMAARRPYQWSYTMATDQVFGSAGDWACRRFAGRPSRFAGTTEQRSERVFGAILDQRFQSQKLDVSPLERALDRCGEELALTIPYTGLQPASNETYQNYMAQMRTAGVTSLYCLCNFTNVPPAMRAASQIGYFPEWLVSSYVNNDDNFIARVFPPEQSKAMVALSAVPKHVSTANRPAFWAIREIDPTYRPPESDPNQGSLATIQAEINYQSLLVLASGIQLAGPNLTPESFERGLQQATFPNPETSLMSGNVGFRLDYSMTDDTAEMWWNGTAQGPQEDEPGAYCYISGGERTGPTGGGSGDELFFGNNKCDTGRGTNYDGR